jgi:hypothetical protein
MFAQIEFQTDAAHKLLAIAEMRVVSSLIQILFNRVRFKKLLSANFSAPPQI